MLTTTFLKTAELRVNNYNPNVVPDKLFKQLVKDIDRIGIQQPILVRQEGNIYIIVDGEHRYRAALELGLQDVPCRIYDELSENEAMVMTISMNRLRGDFDSLKLADVLQKLGETYTKEDLVNLLGYTEQELDNYSSLVKEFDFEAVDAKHAEETDQFAADFNSKKDDSLLDNNFTVPVTPFELLIIESLLDLECEENESKAEALTRLCEDALKFKFPKEYRELQERKAFAESDNEEETVDESVTV